MTEAIIVALITGGISLIGTLATTRSSAKYNYRRTNVCKTAQS